MNYDKYSSYTHSDDDKAERILDTFNYVILVLSIIIAIFILFLGLSSANGDFQLSLLSIFTAVGIVIAGILAWASLKIFINLSDNIREIKDILHRIAVKNDLLNTD